MVEGVTKGITYKELAHLLHFLVAENSRLEMQLGTIQLSDSLFLPHRCLSLLPNDLVNVCRKILGVQPEAPYIYDELESPSNCEYSESGELTGATFFKIVEKITEDGSNELSNSLLYTFPLYASPEKLLDTLITRYSVPIPSLMAANERQLFISRKIRQIQSKVTGFLKKWITLWPEHFEQNTEVRDCLQYFLLGSVNDQDPLIRTNCKAILAALFKVDEPDYNYTFSEARVPEIAHLPKEIDFRTEPLLLWHTLEIARQLTLIEYDYLKKVRISELLARRWERDGKEENAPNVVQISKRFVNGRSLLIYALVNQPDFTNRVKVLKKLLEVSEECLKIHNYESPFTIFSALKSDACRALIRTTREMKKSDLHKSLWKKLKVTYSDDFAEVRKEMLNNHVVVPCFLPLRNELARNDNHRKDVTPSGLLNISKHKITAEIIQKITYYQNNPPPFHRVAVLYDYLAAALFDMDDKELLTIAKSLES